MSEMTLIRIEVKLLILVIIYAAHYLYFITSDQPGVDSELEALPPMSIEELRAVYREKERCTMMRDRLVHEVEKFKLVYPSGDVSLEGELERRFIVRAAAACAESCGKPCPGAGSLTRTPSALAKMTSSCREGKHNVSAAKERQWLYCSWLFGCEFGMEDEFDSLRDRCIVLCGDTPECEV